MLEDCHYDTPRRWNQMAVARQNYRALEIMME